MRSSCALAIGIDRSDCFEPKGLDDVEEICEWGTHRGLGTVHYFRDTIFLNFDYTCIMYTHA